MVPSGVTRCGRSGRFAHPENILGKFLRQEGKKGGQGKGEKMEEGKKRKRKRGRRKREKEKRERERDKG